MKRPVWLLLALFSAACSEGGTQTVAWRGEDFVEVRNLKALPHEIQMVIGVGLTGMQGIADTAERFNITDVVDSTLPMRRFAVGGISPTSVLIAVERGGIAYNIEVSLFGRKGYEQPLQKWTLFDKPESLRKLVASLETKQ